MFLEWRLWRRVTIDRRGGPRGSTFGHWSTVSGVDRGRVRVAAKRPAGVPDGRLHPVSSTSTTLGTRARRIVGEVVRFLLVGGLATVVSFLGFNALVHGLFLDTAPLAGHPVAAFVLVNVLAGCVAYAGMRAWAFRDRGISDPSTGLVRFFGLGALTMAIPVVCLWISRHVLGLSSPLADNLSANVVGLTLGAAARFWVFRRYVFDQAPEPCSPTA